MAIKEDVKRAEMLATRIPQLLSQQVESVDAQAYELWPGITQLLHEFETIRVRCFNEASLRGQPNLRLALIGRQLTALHRRLSAHINDFFGHFRAYSVEGLEIYNIIHETCLIYFERSMLLIASEIADSQDQTP